MAASRRRRGLPKLAKEEEKNSRELGLRGAGRAKISSGSSEPPAKESDSNDGYPPRSAPKKCEVPEAVQRSDVRHCFLTY